MLSPDGPICSPACSPVCVCTPCPQVLLISARNALLSRRVLSGHAAPDTLKRFIRLAFGAAAATGKPGTCPSPEALTSAANAMLDDSGILDLEYKIMNFLAVNAVNVKRLAMLDDVLRLVGEVGNVAASARACLGARAEEVKAAAEGMREEVDSTLSAFDAVMADADAVQVEVGGEVRYLRRERR